MDESAKVFRESRLDLLRFYISFEKQKHFAAKTHYDDYYSEFYYWWFDDFAPADSLFEAAFKPQEIVALQEFTSTFELADETLKPRSFGIDDLLSRTEWHDIAKAAKKAIFSIHSPSILPTR
jgi:hypothetical protein